MKRSIQEAISKAQTVKFNRLVDGLLKTKGVSADEKARLIYLLKKKLFK